MNELKQTLAWHARHPAAVSLRVALMFALWGSVQAADSTRVELGVPAQQAGFTPETKSTDTTKDPIPQLYSHGDPTIAEQLMMELVNRARANPTAEAARQGIDLNQGLSAGTITATPKQPLAFNPNLIASARAHSQWMLDTDTFSHTGTNGSDPGNRMNAAGYQFTGFWTWGENIAWRGTTGTPNLYDYTTNLHNGLFLSSGHRVNICTDLFDELGIGVLQGVFTSSGNNYNAVMAAQNFARSDSTSGPLLTGVVYRDVNTNGFPDPGEGVSGVTVQPDGGSWYTVTSTSGGYAVPYSGLGTQAVVFSGGPLAVPYRQAFVGSDINVKVDLDLRKVIVFVPGSLRWASPQGFHANVSGVAGTRVTLQSSSNRVNWVNLSTYTLSNSPVPIMAAPAPPQAYFRLLKAN